MKPWLITLSLIAVASLSRLSAATIELGWSASELAIGSLEDWEPSTNVTENDGILFTGGDGGTVQSGVSNLARVTRWVNSPGYNLAANPNDSFQDGLGGGVTQDNVSWEMVVRPGDFDGVHTLFNTGGNGDGTAFVLDGSVLDFRFQDANNDDQRVIATADLAEIGAATDFYHVVGICDIVSEDEGTATIWVNGVMIESVTSLGSINDWDGGDLAELGKGNNIPGGNPFGPDPFTGDIAVFNYYGAQILTDEEVAAAFEGFSVPEADSDGDGMPDAYEEENELDPDVNDTAEDKDGDGLTNLQEFEMGLRANKADTDDDGLSDKVETATGTWVNTDDTGTNPAKGDTDDDGLLDGVETNTGVFVSAADSGTDPLNDDTDGDRRKDGREVANGTNPLDASDPPPPDPNNIVSGYWPMDADLLDASGNGGDGTLMDGEDDIPDFVEGKFGGALSLDSVSEFVEINPDLEDLYSGFDVDAGEPNPLGFSVSAWFKVGLWDKSWQCLVAKGEGNRWRIHRRGGETTITGNGGNGDVPAGTIEPEDDQWHLVVLISNPDLDLAQVWVDGQLEGENSGLNLEDTANPMMIGENPDARNRTWNGLVDDVAFFNRALTEEEHLSIWNDGEGALICELAGGCGHIDFFGFSVTKVKYVNGADGAANQVKVTWASRDGATYTVDSSQTIPEEADGWEEVADGVDSGGEETSFSVPVPADATSLYIRVRQE